MKKTPIGGQKCYKIFDMFNILLIPTVSRTKKIVGMQLPASINGRV